MPSINGITASIHTHDGQLQEFAVDEFPGGVSCIIPAHSGQQFWLNYSIDQPIRAKAVSVEFDVDGNRIDTQFPLAAEGSDPATVGPVKSSITSQYIKDDNDNVFRRDVFFTLAERPKSRTSRKAAANTHLGTIECKIYRAEKTGEWNGRISADELLPPSSKEVDITKDISHQARLGASMPAPKTVRYTFKNLDSEDAPFAFFRFYYRSQKYLRTRGYTTASGAAVTESAMIAASTPGSRTTTPAPSGIPRPATRMLTRRASLYNSLSRGKDFISGKKTPGPDHGERSKSPVPVERSLTSPAAVQPAGKHTSETVPRSKSPIPAGGRQAFLNLQAAIAKVEAELTAARQSIEHSDILQSAYEKLGRLKKNSDIVRRKDTKGKKPDLKTTIPEEVSDKSSVKETVTPTPTPITPDLKGKGKEEPVLPIVPGPSRIDEPRLSLCNPEAEVKDLSPVAETEKDELVEFDKVVKAEEAEAKKEILTN